MKVSNDSVRNLFIDNSWIRWSVTRSTNPMSLFVLSVPKDRSDSNVRWSIYLLYIVSLFEISFLVSSFLPTFYSFSTINPSPQASSIVNSSLPPFPHLFTSFSKVRSLIIFIFEISSYTGPNNFLSLLLSNQSVLTIPTSSPFSHLSVLRFLFSFSILDHTQIVLNDAPFRDV